MLAIRTLRTRAEFLYVRQALTLTTRLDWKLTLMKRHEFRARFLPCLIFSLLLPLCAGCGEAKKPDVAPRHQVAGTVKLNGTLSSGVSLSFIPSNGTPGLGGYGVTNESGAFSVTDLNGTAGLQQGEYFITFSKIVMEDGSPIPKGDDAINLSTKELLPESLRTVDPERHRYRVTVDGPIETLNFEITSNSK